jgi:hypothetical protein
VRNAFDAGSFHVGKWEGVEPWKSRVFLGPLKRHRADRREPFRAQRTRVPGPNPYPLAKIMDAARNKSSTLRTGPRINHKASFLELCLWYIYTVHDEKDMVTIAAICV